MDALILFSHGSLLCGAGEALLAHAVRLREGGAWAWVGVGYLNYSDPPFAQTANEAIAAGATRLVIAPYFLIPGYFVTKSLPEVVQPVRDAHPDVKFVVAEALGFDDALADALLEAAGGARDESHWRDPLLRAARSCRPSPDCPLYGTPAVPKSRCCLPMPTPASGPKGSETLPNTTTSRDALLVLVHGSPRPAANGEMFRVVESLKARPDSPFGVVEVGFMECNTPTIPDAIAACVTQGASRVIAVPYFLHTGTHVCDDLPTLLEAAQMQYPHVTFLMGDYVGLSPRLTDLLARRAEAVR